MNTPFIQISDVCVGLLGKMSKFINTHSRHEIVNLLKELSPVQILNIKLLATLIKSSVQKNPALLCSLDSNEETSKRKLLLNFY
jgi:hypothetical protein